MLCNLHFGVKTFFRYRALPALYSHNLHSLLSFSLVTLPTPEYAKKVRPGRYTRTRVALVGTRGRVRLPTIASYAVIYTIRCRVGLT